MVCKRNNPTLNAEKEPQDLDYEELMDTIHHVSESVRDLKNKTSSDLTREVESLTSHIAQAAETAHQELQNAVDEINQNLDGISEQLDTDIVTLNSVVNAAENRVNTRVDNIIANSTSTEGNSELIDIRTAQNGTVYQTAGSSIRSQFEDTYKIINECSSFIETLGFPHTVVSNREFVAGAYVDANGYRNSGNYAMMRTHHQLIPLDNYTIHLDNALDNMLISIGLFSDGMGTWLRLYPSLDSISNSTYTIDSQDIISHFPGAQFIRINVLSYSDNTYYDISNVIINVIKEQSKTIIDDLNTLETIADSHESSLQKLLNHETRTPICYNTGYKNISIIGDSISQGATVTSIPDDSYCGILRKMFSVELGGKLNYGFSAFDKSTDLGFENSTVTWVYGSPSYGWQRNYSDSTVLGGDSYTSTSVGSKFCFKLWKNFHYMQIAIVGGSDKGSFSISDSNDNLIAEIDCKDYPAGACLSEKIDISCLDASNGFSFVISTNSNESVIISGVSLSNSDDYWTFNNYGRAGASPSVFTGSIFSKESECSVMIYALGVNAGLSDLNNAIAAIKNEAKGLNAKKLVLCMCFKGNGFDNRSGGKPAALKSFAEEIGATFIDVYEHCPKDSNGNPIEGFLANDNVHPTNEGHRFIAELIAKTIGLSCDSKGMAEVLFLN